MKTRIIFFGLVVFVLLPAAWSQKPFPKAPPGVEEALRARVSEYYTLFGQSKFRQAEALVTEESKDTFYTMNKSRHMGFAIKGVTFTDDVKGARVLVTLMMIIPMMGSKPLPFPVSTQWRLVDGEWYAHIPQFKPGDVVKTPFGLKTVVEREYVPRTPIETEPRPDLKSVGRMFRLDRNTLEFPASAPGPVTETISLENRSRGELTIRNLSKGINGVETELKPASIPPGETGDLTFTYRPAVRELRRKFRMRFVIEPIARRFTVKLNFRDRELEYQDQAGMTYGESVTVTGLGRQSLTITDLTPGQTYRVSTRAKMLEGDEGGVFLSGHEGNRRDAVTDGPFQLSAGEERTLAIDFRARGAAMMRIDLGYTGTTGRVGWSKVSVTPLLQVNPPVANADFESPFLHPWKRSAKVRAKVEKSAARTGTGSIELSGEPGYVFQDVTGLSPGRRYEVRAWARAADGRPAVAALGVHDKRNRHEQSSGMRGVSVSDYELLTVPFTASETGVVRIHLTYHGGEGPVYFDDVAVREAGTPNGGFENFSLEPWTSHGDAEAAVEKEVVFSGVQSLAQSGAIGGVSQTITDLDPGKRYQVIAWVRAAPEGDAQAALKLGDGRKQDGPRTVSTERFEPFAVDFEPEADGTVELALERAGGSGALYWDDVFVRERR